MRTKGVAWWAAAVGLIVLAVLAIGLWSLLDLGSTDRDATSTSTPRNTTSPSPPRDTPSPSASQADNGAYFTSVVEDGQVTILRHPIDVTGSFGVPAEVYRGPMDRTGPAVVDGRSPWVLLGWYGDGVTERVQVRKAGSAEVLGAVDAARWCGGEGPDGYACTLLGNQLLARTTVVAPGYYQPVSILVSSIETGSTVTEYGPFPGLQAMLGTASPDHLVLQLADAPTDASGLPTGEMVDLDLTTGRTTPIGRYSAGWAPLCVRTVRWQTDGSPDGMTVVGIQRAGQGSAERLSLSGLGPVEVAPVTWSAAEGYEPSGCSADGRFVYLTLLESDAEGVTRVVVDRITVQDGRRVQVLDAPPPIPGPWTR